MREYTLKELKELCRLGMAKNITNAKPEEIPQNYEKIGYSSGTYGINGGLIQDKNTGEYYAITARNSNLFRIF